MGLGWRSRATTYIWLRSSFLVGTKGLCHKVCREWDHGQRKQGRSALTYIDLFRKDTDIPAEELSNCMRDRTVWRSVTARVDRWPLAIRRRRDHGVSRNAQLSSGRELLVKRKHTSHCVLIDGTENDTGVTTARNIILLKRPAHPVVSQQRWPSIHGVHSATIGTRAIQCVQSDVVNMELGVRCAQDCCCISVWKGEIHIYIVLYITTYLSTAFNCHWTTK